jgi:uncharacterized repeat protein (TIGR03803 family)
MWLVRGIGRAALAGVAAGAVVAVTAGAGLVSGASRVPAAAVEKVLYSFGGADGAGPLTGVTPGPGGVLYGTTVFGGAHGDGTVFTLTRDAAGEYTERVVFSFGGRDGSKPGGNVAIGGNGDLFGDTVIGGADGDGTVFELMPSGSGYHEKVLYSFTGSLDGGQPLGTPVLNSRGDIFGVTQFGGTGGQGVIFELEPTGTGYPETVLHSFTAEGSLPQAGLTMGSGGTLYGTLYGASAEHPDGTVFSLRQAKAGPVYHVLYYFGGRDDGNNPFASLTVDGTTRVIYGSTEYGGSGGSSGSYGTVFSLTPTASGKYTERVLHSFAVSRDGMQPEAPLLLTAAGDLYGTATLAGVKCHGTGCGTIFELVPSGSGGFGFRLVYRFTGSPDGADPESSGLVAGPGGTLFGTTRSGGTVKTCSDGGPGGVPGCGTVYELTP